MARDGLKFVSAVVSVSEPEALRTLGAQILAALGEGMVTLGAVFDGRASLTVHCSPAAIKAAMAELTKLAEARKTADAGSTKEREAADEQAQTAQRDAIDAFQKRDRELRPWIYEPRLDKPVGIQGGRSA